MEKKKPCKDKLLESLESMPRDDQHKIILANYDFSDNVLESRERRNYLTTREIEFPRGPHYYLSNDHGGGYIFVSCEKNDDRYLVTIKGLERNTDILTMRDELLETVAAESIVNKEDIEMHTAYLFDMSSKNITSNGEYTNKFGKIGLAFDYMGQAEFYPKLERRFSNFDSKKNTLSIPCSINLKSLVDIESYYRRVFWKFSNGEERQMDMRSKLPNKIIGYRTELKLNSLEISAIENPVMTAKFKEISRTPTIYTNPYFNDKIGEALKG